MISKENQFPKIKKAIDDFINDEDGSILRSRIISIGSMVLLMTIFAGIEAYAAHSSHKSHSSHSSTSYYRGHVSHTSHSSHVSGSNSRHGSHSNHSDHASHASHTSHANTSAHSNSIYSREGDVTYGPDVSDIPGIETPQSTVDYANITMSDKVSIVAPILSDSIDSVYPNDIQEVDIPDSVE